LILQELWKNSAASQGRSGWTLVRQLVDFLVVVLIDLFRSTALSDSPLAASP
jgi:hypothetical protein